MPVEEFEAVTDAPTAEANVVVLSPRAPPGDARPQASGRTASVEYRGDHTADERPNHPRRSPAPRQSKPIPTPSHRIQVTAAPTSATLPAPAAGADKDD